MKVQNLPHSCPDSSTAIHPRCWKPRDRVLWALSGLQPDRVPFCEPPIAQNVCQSLTGHGKSVSEREISDCLGRDVVVAIVHPPYFADHGVSENGQSYVLDGWIKTRADLPRMVFPDPTDPHLYAAAEKVLAEKGDYAAGAAIKLGVAPSLVSMGLDGLAYAIMDDPGLVHEVVKRYVDWQVTVTDRLCRMGFDFVWSFDDIAYKTGPFFSRAVLQDFFMPAFRRSVEAISLPWIYHSDGNITPVLEDLLSLGMNAIHPLEPGPMDLGDVKAGFGQRVCLVGNVSVDTLAAGTPEAVRACVRECMTKGKPGGGYMISSSNSIPTYARPENVRAMAQAIRDFAPYPQ
jgi:uroporphyrinogen decarboxylase